MCLFDWYKTPFAGAFKNCKYLYTHINPEKENLICSESIAWRLAQSEFTCLKLTIKALEQGVKYVQS